MKKWISVLLVVVVVSAFGQAWDIKAVDTTGNVGLFTSLAIDSENNPHIAYLYADSAFLKYAAWNGTDWDIEVVDDNGGLGGVGFFASLALGPLTDLPQIAYYDVANANLKWASLDGSGHWIVGTPDPSDNDVGQGCDIAVDQDDYAHICYYDATTNYLLYVRSSATGWMRDTVDSVGPLPIFGTDISGTSITLDSIGTPYIAYYAWDGDPLTGTGYLKYAYLVSGNWMIDTVEMVPGDNIGAWPDILINENAGSFPYISYFNATNGYFTYARWTGSAWAIDVIDQGLYGSQALGSTHASYYSEVNGDLKYAYSENYLGWHTEKVDTTGDVGKYTSIALSYQGEVSFPHISYYDATNGDLKYVTKIIKDVLPITWWFQGHPPDFRQIHPDSIYTPMATVRNQSNTPVTFNVEFKIFYSGFQDYSSTKAVGPLGVDEEAEVTFNGWLNVPHHDSAWYDIRLYTLLAGDSVPDNDTIYDSLYCTSAAVKEKEIAPTTYELSVTGGAVMLALPVLTDGELYVLDIAGRRRLTLHEGMLAAGVHEFTLDESALPNGVYFIKFSSPAANLTRKTVLVR